jgi:hypothetical protein
MTSAVMRPSKYGDLLLSRQKVWVRGVHYELEHRDFIGTRGYTVYEDGVRVTDYAEYIDVLEYADLIARKGNTRNAER